MKYYLVEIATGDSKIQGKAVYEYQSHIEAMSAYHRKLGTAMGSEMYETDLCMVIGEDGTVFASEHFKRTVTEE